MTVPSRGTLLPGFTRSTSPGTTSSTRTSTSCPSRRSTAVSGASSISFELLLIKLRNDPAARDSIRAAADAFKAETVDYTRESIVIRVTADSVRIDSFLDLMRDYDILEICRTGVVSLERGAETIRSGMQV